LGWPWTEESEQPRDIMPDGRLWPLVSIVTPSYNQAPFIEETIRSVLLQGYPNLEYIIIDGYSTDGTVAIIEKYYNWLAYWASEPDGGQSEAINKGWGHCKGEIFAWINSDDSYCLNAIRLAVEGFRTDSIDLVYGDCNCVDVNSSRLGILRNRRFNLKYQMTGRNLILQPASFFKHKILEKVGGLDVNLHYVMDYDLWVRMLLAGCNVKYIPFVLSNYRVHDTAKSIASQLQMRLEIKKVLDYVYQSDTISFDIRRWKRDAYSNFHRFVGEAYLMVEQMTLARREFWQVILLKPFQPAMVLIFGYLVDTWLGTNLGNSIQRFVWRLKKIPDEYILMDGIIRGSFH
jgi:glycosyltransferase involved in cell wall biosynthesis